MRQKSALILIVFLFILTNIASAYNSYNINTYNTYTQSLLITDWNYSFDNYSNDLIFRPTNVMFDKIDINFQRDMSFITMLDDDISLVGPYLVFILGSLAWTYFVWLLKRKRMI